MGYLFSAETDPVAAKALDVAKSLLVPGTIMALVASYHGETYSIMVKVDTAGNWLSTGVAGGVFTGEGHGLAIVAGLIGAAVYHGGAMSYAVNTGQWQKLL